MRNRDLYETDMHNMYNLIMVHTNKQLQEKVASDATLQAVNTVRDNIGYLMILKKLCFSNQSGQHPIRSILLATSLLYNTMQHVNNNMTD